MKKKLFIISNESIFSQNNKFFCDNIDIKSTPEGLKKNFEINIFGRKSSKKRSHEIKIKNIKIFNNIYTYISEVISASKEQNSEYLVISISPYTFLICLFLRLFGKSPIVYLRSDGFGEYRAIFGRLGVLIYFFMFHITSLFSKLISCRNYILRGKKGAVVSPSQLDISWTTKLKNLEVKKFNLLYVGRIRIEKGIFSLVKLIKNKHDIFLSIVGAQENEVHKINQNNVKIYPIEKNKNKLIKIYDDHNIFVLPSFTEGHPMVLLEALARRRPVIIFDEIKHIIGDKKGIFVSNRNTRSFLENLNYIKKNYAKIQKEMTQNNLPTKKNFEEELTKIINNI
tara:strand:- start:3605 stop:4624 length:1020 start_codon:yes stop_codon:yes gene_type:complete